MVIGLSGAAFLAVAGFLAVGTGSGGPGIYFQLAGLGAWVVWIVTASIRQWTSPA